MKNEFTSITTRKLQAGVHGAEAAQYKLEQIGVQLKDLDDWLARANTELDHRLGTTGK